MRLAERFRLPVLTFVDTAGAYPGIDAEARGQAEAIARAVETCLQLTVPLVATVIGEGGSGGAIALAAGNSVLMLENAIYSVISPEGCASILWRSADKVEDAAEALRLTAQDLLRLGIIDGDRGGAAGRRPPRAARRRSPPPAMRSRPRSQPLLALDGAALRAGAAGEIPAHGKSRPLTPYRVPTYEQTRRAMTPQERDLITSLLSRMQQAANQPKDRDAERSSARA